MRLDLNEQLKIIAPTEKKAKRNIFKERRRFLRIMGLSTAGLATMYFVGFKTYEGLRSKLNRNKVAAITYDESDIFSSSFTSEIFTTEPTITPESEIIETPKGLPNIIQVEDDNLNKNSTEDSSNDVIPTVTPTIIVEQTSNPVVKEEDQPTVEEEIGNKNLVEHLLGPLVDAFYKKRLERSQNDPAFAERVAEKEIKAEEINFAILGIDQARWRKESWEGYGENGYGNNDVTIVVSLNPKTLKAQIRSFPRDLFSPETQQHAYTLPRGRDPIKHDTPIRRINAITAHTTLSPEQQVQMTHQVLETATAPPIDGIIKFNMDFVMDFLTELCPDGLEIDVPQDIDITYLYGTESVLHSWKQGKQRLKGRDLIAYARTRKDEGGDDDTRGTKQRQVLNSFILDYSLRISDDLINFKLDNLYLLASVLEKQQGPDIKNLFSSIGISNILNIALSQVEEYLTNEVSNGRSILTALVLNTMDKLSSDIISSIGVGDIQNNDEQPLVKYIKSQTQATEEEVRLRTVDPKSENGKPTEYGNYMQYWKPLRDFFLKVNTNS